MKVLRRPDQHLALGSVLAVVVLGLALVVMDYTRLGVGTMAAALWLACALRTFAPATRQGILAVRSRRLDIPALAALALALTVLAIVIPVRE